MQRLTPNTYSDSKIWDIHMVYNIIQETDKDKF